MYIVKNGKWVEMPGSLVDDLRHNEEPPKPIDETAFIDPAEPLTDMIGHQHARMEKKYETGLEVMDNNTAINKASNSGNETLKKAKRTVDAGGQEAVNIASVNQQQIRIEQNKTKNQLLNSIITGVDNGVKNTASHLGENLGGKAGDSIFGSNNKGNNTGNTGSSNNGNNSPGTDHSSVGPNTTYAGGDTSPQPTDNHSGNYVQTPGGGTNTGSTTSSSAASGGPVCVICGGPAYMEFEGVGWLCHDCEKKGYGHPPDSGNTGTEETVLADAVCPVCGQMYNPAYGHHCPGPKVPAASQPTSQPAGPMCQMGKRYPGAPVTTVEGQTIVLCNACRDNNRCSRCGRVAQNLGGAGYDFTDDNGNRKWGHIENACQACIEQWKKQQGVQ